MMIVEERTFVDAHGVQVFSRWWPIDGPRGVVLVSHGASEHSGRYDRFAEALNGAGFAVVALDHRGHGRTTPATGPGVMGPGGGDAVVDDLHELRAAAASSFDPDVPVLVFGHSMGALIGLAAGVLCGFPAGIDEAASMGAALQGFADAGMRDEPAEDLLRDNNAPFEPARTPFDWLSRDPEEVDRYLSDPMCGDDNPLTYGYLIDLLGVVAPAVERLAAISCPVLVIAGDEDPAAAMGAHPKALARALDEAARHELLNETNRDEVTADVVEWLRSRSPAP